MFFSRRKFGRFVSHALNALCVFTIFGRLTFQSPYDKLLQRFVAFVFFFISFCYLNTRPTEHAYEFQTPNNERKHSTKRKILAVQQIIINADFILNSSDTETARDRDGIVSIPSIVHLSTERILSTLA